MAEEASAPAPAPADPPAAQPTTDPAVTAPVPGVDAAAFEAPPEVDPADLAAAGAALDQISIEELLKQASFEDPTAVGSAVAAPDASELKLPNFQQVMQDAQVSSIELLRDVELNVKIELGRARMLVEDVLKLSEGS